MPSDRPRPALLDSTIRDPLLRGVLAAQCGNHGLPPSKVSLPLHASMTSHYFDGAYYPRGGAKRIPAAYIRALRKLGGAIRLHTPVTRILVEDGRAVGVQLLGGERLSAGHVVCNADPAVTFGRLLAPELCPSELAKVRRTTYSVGMLSVFAAVRDLDLRAMGFDSGNYWFYRHPRVAEIYERALSEAPREVVDGLFLTITSLKDPGHTEPGTHAIEMFTFVPYDTFGRWADPEGAPGPSPSEENHPARGADYEALKRALGDKMLDAAEEVIPGLRSHLSFLSIGTPLTNDHYCRSYRGAIYGTAKTPLQVGPFSFATKGPVDGLFFSGSSILSHGVAGASMSGLMAARALLGLRSVGALVGPGDGSLRIVSADDPSPAPAHRRVAHAA
jgi:phytoene dehydrogenase-like protein